MSNLIFVKPRAGGRIRMPERNYNVMPDSGAFVPQDSFYQRLLDGGDVVACDPPKAKVPAKGTQSKTAEAQPAAAPSETASSAE